MDMQKKLSVEQVQKFYHNDFVDSQVKAFKYLIGNLLSVNGKVVDVGGGAGYFALEIQKQLALNVRVLDTDDYSVAICIKSGLNADLDDALSPSVRDDDVICCFNMILHHLVGKNEEQTNFMQCKALRAWIGKSRKIFVNEYIYESYFYEKLSAKLIWYITSSNILSTIGKLISRIVPSLRANTFGVGVRFRAKSEWIELFETLGLEITGYDRGVEESTSMSVVRRLLFIKSCRRDSFLLQSKSNEVPLN